MTRAEWHDHLEGSILLVDSEIVAVIRLVDLDFGYKAWDIDGHLFGELPAAKKYAQQRYAWAQHP
jgi:hypothetical protein